ncbi:hypothetical protein HHI36_016183 [Cryptolaemus montrouzieri]|uniref:A-kinase anchor protein 17A n=1 Tax=Cryptolaemus montrouzieri TaxID=559131 RepID=A0ABD2NJS2_9CUCU
MNAFQTCRDFSDIIPLYLPQQLYLKPIAKLNISLQLPNVTKVGKSISHWEIMEKIRELILPEEFIILKVSKTTLEFVRFDAEINSRKKLENVVNKLDNKTIKLKNFSELMRLRAAIAKSEFPTRHVWDGFFHEAKDMNEMKPGERPDTVYLSNLPTKWFVPYHLADEDLLPSEKVFYKIFEKFGPIRYVDIPICDPYRDKMKNHISGIKNCVWENKEIFEGYVQFKDYIGFTKCMDLLKDMKLLHKDEDEAFTVDIKVDFDRSKHLSDASIRRREIVRDRLVKKQREKEERDRNELEEKKKKEEEEKQKELDTKHQKEQRRKLREEKGKQPFWRSSKSRDLKRSTRKLPKRRKNYSKRIKDKRELEEPNPYSFDGREADRELQTYKKNSELDYLNQKQKLHNAIQGRVMLKTVLQGDNHHNFSSSSSDEEQTISSSRPAGRDEVPYQNGRLVSGELYDQPLWYGYPYHMPTAAPLYQPNFRGHPAHIFPNRGRGTYPKLSYHPGPSRGSYFTRRPRGYKSQYRGGYRGRYHYPPEIEQEYIKYFSKFLQTEYNDHGERSTRSRSRRSRSRSYSRHRSYSKSRSYSRSVSRSGRTRSRSSSRSRRSRRSISSRRRSRSRSRSRSRRSRSKDRSESRNKSSRSKRTPEVDCTKDKGNCPRRKRSRSTSVKSVDSSKFVSPNRLRRERSKSWSLPKDGENKRKDSWSRSPEQTK